MRPPVVGDQLDTLLPRPRGWSTSLAPAFLGVLSWFPLLDALGTADSTGSISGGYVAAGLALAACFLLMYLPLATLGLRSRRRLAVVAAEALGVDGAEWIAGVLYGLIAAIWCSTAIGYSVRLTLSGLVAWGLLDDASLLPTDLGGIRIEGPLVLVSLAFWTFIIVSANGLGLMGVIAALMKIYSPFATFLLVVAAIWGTIQGELRTPNEVVASGSWSTDARIFQLVFGAFAFAGVMAVEWGAVVRGERDVRIGGLAGVLASGATTFLAALTLSKLGADRSLYSALVGGLGGSVGRWVSGSLLLLFGLASLAPACYGSALFTRRFRAHWPGLRRWKGVVLGFLLFFLPGVVGVAGKVEAIAAVSGACFAPLAGILAARFLLMRGRPGGIRPGWSTLSVAAWGVGVMVSFAPFVGELGGVGWLKEAQPAALFGYLASAIVCLASSPTTRVEA